MNFSLPQKLLVTVIPSASKSDRRPADWETQGQWDKTSLLCYPSLGPCFQISEACLEWSCLSLPHSPLLPELLLTVQLQTVRQPQKYSFQCQSGIFLKNKSTLKMRTWKSSKGWCLFHRGQLVPVHHFEGQEIQQQLGLGIKKRPASQCFSLIQPQSCMLLKGQWSLHPQRPRRPEISLPRHSLA